MNYKIAEIRIAIPDELSSGHFEKALAPFIYEGAEAVQLTVQCREKLSRKEQYAELDHFEFSEADAACTFGHDAEGYILEMMPHDGSPSAVFRMSPDCKTALTDFNHTHLPSLFRFGLWIALNCYAVQHLTVAIHSSTIVYRSQAVMMLGESGTGKSTHTRLWREHIEGCHLLNDDSPYIVANNDGTSEVYGSAWSGKTPCYINRHYPIRAIIRLSQAPYNKIRRLRPIEAIGALLPSCPPAFAHDKFLFDHVCKTVSALLSHTEVYHLECLPNAAAAELVRDTLFAAK